MKVCEVIEKVKRKAGIVPYVVWNGIPYALVMKPSDPGWGGSLFQIAKGGVEKGEDMLSAAFREGEEELGIRSNDIEEKPTLALKTLVSGVDETYELYVYTVKMTSKKISGKPHFETGETDWVTEQELGRINAKQQPILRQIFQNI